MTIDIPKEMCNEESKLVAEVVCFERDNDIINAKLFGAQNRLKIFLLTSKPTSDKKNQM